MNSSPEGDTPRDAIFTTDGQKFLVANRDSHNILVYDATTRAILADIPVTGEPVNLAVSPDGNYALSANTSGDNIAVINLNTLTLQTEVPVSRAWPYKVKVTPDGQYAIAATAENYFVRISMSSFTQVGEVASANLGATSWSLSAGRRGGVYPRYRDFAISPDSSTLISSAGSGSAGAVRIYDIASDTETAVLPVSSPLYGVTVTADSSKAYLGSRYASGGDFVVEVDLTNNSILRTLNTETLTNPAIMLTPDQQYLMASGFNKLLFLDLTDGSTSNSVGVNPFAFALSHDGKYVLLGNGISRVVDVQTQSQVYALPSAYTDFVAVSPVDYRAIQGTYVWGEELAVVNINGSSSTQEAFLSSGGFSEADRPFDLAITPDGLTAITVNYESDNVSIVDLTTRTVTDYIDTGVNPDDIAITPDGLHAVVTNPGSDSVSIIDIATKTVVATLTGFIEDPRHVVISADGQTAFVNTTRANDSTDKVYFINLNGASSSVTGFLEVGNLANDAIKYSEMTLSPDGSLLAIPVSRDNELVLISTASQTEIARVATGQKPVEVRFSPDGSRLYTLNVSSQSVSVIDVNGAASDRVAEIGLTGFVKSMVIDESGDFLYVASWANAGLEVIDLSTNTVAKTLPAFNMSPTDIQLVDDIIYIVGSPGTSIALPLVDDLGTIARVLADGPDTVVIDESPVSGVPLHLAFSEPLMMAIPVLRFDDGVDLISYLSEGTGDEDFYEFNLVAGDQVNLSTALPGSDPGLFENNLNVAVELYDPADRLLDRGIDGSLSYIVPSTGTYKARVYAQGFTSGEYLFSVATTPTVTLTVDSSTVAENGGTASITATLSSLVTSDVVVDIAATGTALGAGVDYSLPTQITILAGQSQGSVTVSAVDDSIAELSESVIIDITAVTNAVEDPAQQVTATITDDDPAGFNVTETSGSTSVSETGTTDSFDVVLTAAPQSNVVFTLVADNSSEATIDKNTLTFTTANWNIAQTVTVTGVDDPIVDGDQISSVTISVDDSSSDDLFDPLADSTVSVTTTSDDIVGFAVTPTDGTTIVSEAATTDTFDVVLTAVPLTDVVFTVSSSDPTEASVDKVSLTFTPADWNSPQTVTVTGVDDFIIDGDRLSNVTIAVDTAASDDAFDLLSGATLDISTTDNDVAGFIVAETAGKTIVSEEETSDTFTVVLTAEPSSGVVLSVTSGDTEEAILDLSQLTFTSANWNQPQTVTVTGIDDLIADGAQTTLIVLSVIDASSDNNFDALGDQTVSVSTEDDDDGILRGVKFEDLDADGFRDADERGLAGVTIYLDANNNGALDSGELSTLTDANGAYEFTNAYAGTHVIREVVPADHSQTAPGQSAAFFYGIDATTDELVQVDAATGQVSRIGPHGVSENLSGIVYTSTGRIYGTHNAATDSFYSIDPQTGDATLVGPTGMQIAGGMAYDAVTDTIYGLGQVNSVWTLVTFDEDSGAATAVGAGSVDVNAPTGLAFDSANNRVIVFDNTDDQFIGFDTDGSASIIGTSTAAINFWGLTYAGSTLVSSQHIDGTELRSVDPVTGAASNFVTLSEPVFFGTLEYVEPVNQAHVISISQSGVFDGLNFGNDPLPAEIRGTKFEDVNANGQWDSGEPPLAGVTIYLDQNGNGRFDNGGVLEPDDFPAGTTIGDTLAFAVVTATYGEEFSALATSKGVAATTASTGTRVFANPVNGAAMSATEYQLRIDVLDIVESISIDFTALDGSARGRLRIFDAANNVVGTYSTAALAKGESATMQLFGTGIAYAIADSTNSLTGTLDNLKFNGGVEPQTTTDANGDYSFTGLPPGEYSVREVVPDGFRQTSPVSISQQRLFAVDPRTTSATQIIEIDPTTGVTINSFNAPGAPSGTVSGLAFDGQTLYFIDASGDTLFELDPVTGAILDSIPRSTTPRWDGLAVLDGLVYLNDSFSDVIEVIDPTTNTLVNTITLDPQSNFNPFGALGELPDASGGQLIGGIGSSTGITLLDPVTGAVNSTFFHASVSGGSHYGLTSLDNEIYIGFNNSVGTVQVYSPSGSFIRSFNVGFDVSALGGGGSISGGHNVTLIANQLVTDLDFGNERLLGDIGGRKFEDINGNGQQDTGEDAMVGVTIYLDANDNGELDGGELSTTTDSNGDYLFASIPIGDYVVRELLPSGFVQTTPGFADDFYYAINHNTDSLFRVDAISGAITDIGPHNAPTDLWGLVVTNSGELFANSWQNDYLYSIDPETGAATEIGHAGGQIGGGLGYDEATDTIYGVIHGGAGTRLATIDRTTGAAVAIGPGVANLTGTTGIEFDPITGLVIVFDNSGREFFGFDPRTGSGGVLSFINPSISTYGLTFNGTDLQFANSGRIYNLDVLTGTYTQTLLMSAGPYMDGLEYVAAKDGSHRVKLLADGALTDLDFGNRQAVGDIHGIKFDDANGNGIQDAGESVIVGATVYLDVNNNSTFDSGELSTTTDGAGAYTLVDVPVGDHVIRDIVPGGYVQTLPGHSRSYFYGITYPAQELVTFDAVNGIVSTIGALNAGSSLNGLVLTNSGQLIAASWQSDSLYSIDASTGAATLIGPANAQIAGGLGYDPATDTIYTVVTGGAGSRLATFDRNTGTATAIGPGIADLTGTTGIEFDPVTGLVIVFDTFGDEYFGFDPRTGEASVLSIANPALSTGGLTFDGTDLVLARGNQILSVDVNTGALTPKMYLSSSTFLEALAHVAGNGGGHHVSLGVGDVLIDQDFAIRAAVGEIRGIKFNDLNSNGVQDSGEGVFEGVTIYLDTNDNGSLDSGEPSTTTDASGNYVFSNVPVGDHIVREVDQSGHTNTSPGYSDSFFYALDQATQELVKIDATSGRVTRIGAHGTGVVLDGLTVTNSGQLFASTAFGTDSLYSIDPNTGLATLIGATGGNIGSDLTYDAATDTIYTVVYETTTRLAIIDRTTGLRTAYGPGVSDLTLALGLTFDPVTNSVIVFDYNGSEFFSSSADTGIGTLLSAPTPPIISNGFTTTESGMVMSNSGTTLIQVDPTTGSQSSFLSLSESVNIYALEYVRGTDAAHRVTVDVGEVVTQVDFGSHYIPPTPQQIGQVVINDGAANRSGIGTLAFTFDINVTATSTSTLRLFNHTTQQLIDVSTAILSDNGTPTLTWDLSAISLPRGRYTAELWPDQIVSDEGVHPDFVKVAEFLVNRGDLNGDGRVNVSDYSVIGANYDPLLGTVYREGDANGDGRVNVSDYAAIGANYNPLLLSLLAYDFGDAPETGTQFATTLANDGAKHIYGSGLLLGSVVDVDTDGQPSTNADGDGADDDGLSFGSLQQGLSSNLVVDAIVPNVAFLNVWIDFNQDGAWDNTTDEHVLNDVAVSDGSQTLVIDIPGNALVGSAIVRARITEVPGTASFGLASSGEVEDYIIQIEAPNSGSGAAGLGSGSSGGSDGRFLMQGGTPPDGFQMTLFGMPEKSNDREAFARSQDITPNSTQSSGPGPAPNRWQDVFKAGRTNMPKAVSRNAGVDSVNSLTQLFEDQDTLEGILHLI